MSLFKIKILDCTLRDGGYRNSWQFCDEQVQAYIDSLPQYDVDIAEIGFRYQKSQNNYGICAYTPDEFLDSLVIPENLKIAVMVKAEHFDNNTQLNSLFSDSSLSRVDIVRIAVPYHRADEYLWVIETLKEKNYDVLLNLTKLSRKSTVKLNTMPLIEPIIDTLYFADTFGELGPEHIEGIIQQIKSQYSGPIGFHGHDNIGLALTNTLTAIEHGATYVDSTIGGIGKGVGNLKTEDITSVLVGQTLAV